MDAIKKVNWLAQRWPIEKWTTPYGGWTIHIGGIEGNRIFQATDVGE